MLGAEHPNTLSSASNLAGVLQKQGDHARALEPYRKALAITEQSLGPQHPSPLQTLVTLGLPRHPPGPPAPGPRHQAPQAPGRRRAPGPKHFTRVI